MSMEMNIWKILKKSSGSSDHSSGKNSGRSSVSTKKKAPRGTEKKQNIPNETQSITQSVTQQQKKTTTTRTDKHQAQRESSQTVQTAQPHKPININPENIELTEFIFRIPENQPDMIFCPFREVIIDRIYSELLEKIGSFPMLVLAAAEKKQTPTQIAESICTIEFVVTDVADELTANGLLVQTKAGEPLCLTELGVRYLRIRRFIEEFEQDRSRRFAVNLFTCQLEHVPNQHCFEYIERPQTNLLWNKLRGGDRLLSTPDYENTKEYMKQYLDLSAHSLTEDDYDYISFQLMPQGEIFYVPYILPTDALPLASENCLNAFCANIPVDTIKMKLMTELDLSENGKELKEAILRLCKAMPSFLSDAGRKTADQYQMIQTFNSKMQPQQINLYNGQEYREEVPFAMDDISRISVSLSARYMFPQEPVDVVVKEQDCFACFSIEKHETICVRLDFTKLIPYEEGVK